MADHMQLMERLLKHHLPAIDLETESLRQACDALSVPSPGLTVVETQDSQVMGSPEPRSPKSSSGVGLESEGCTIDNVNGAIARRSALNASSRRYLRKKLITALPTHRLFWRVLCLEFLNACETQC